MSQSISNWLCFFWGVLRDNVSHGKMAKQNDSPVAPKRKKRKWHPTIPFLKTPHFPAAGLMRSIQHHHLFLSCPQVSELLTLPPWSLIIQATLRIKHRPFNTFPLPRCHLLPQHQWLLRFGFQKTRVTFLTGQKAYRGTVLVEHTLWLCPHPVYLWTAVIRVTAP